MEVLGQAGRTPQKCVAAFFKARDIKKPEPEKIGKNVPPFTATVMIVDDEDYVRNVLVRLLGSLRCGFESLKNPRDAITVFRDKAIDLVISDYHMPEMTGLQLLRELKAIDPDAKVIICSGGLTQKEEIDELMSAGALAVISKPYDTEEIKSLVRKYI